MSFSWQVTPEQAWIPVYAIYAQRIEDEIVAMANGLTDEIADWMKAEARWTDRTGDARAALYSDVIHAARQSVAILASHGPAISYAEALETVSGGRFGIIADTIDNFGPRVFHEVQAILARVRVP
jgi:hypothetical protein